LNRIPSAVSAFMSDRVTKMPAGGRQTRTQKIVDVIERHSHNIVDVIDPVTEMSQCASNSDSHKIIDVIERQSHSDVTVRVK
jgi:Zn-dependent M32 family carboxypeptidase